MRIASKRLGKELAELRTKGTPTGVEIIQDDDLQEWKFSLRVLGDSLYHDQVFALRFRFSDQYPLESPEVVFITTDGYKAPVHPHIYSNGHICASILGNEWSPVLNVSSVLLTLQSMLASCKKLEVPPDNESYCKRAPKSPKDSRFVYHDDSV
ncbi:uncharacterized protein PFL1_02219 [Pseudozyma flocculosa PF-1]|uniref:Related to ubiquitin-conjugating enzyme n=1 Tax=Pseudozyma flocculosa TaxID=84751 RepID=A0A5C3FB29_9BASI|nr:uncharacterized protein PFL1_02219 [Pseudozyma flocculosa PF-1]EPQ30102.1 hypothetical protein PFL1_02219 [Pseudozyma flocculosa PF-1]SPO41450.1 related to ubiquitin-conjugating enzyme [Pseudozyma flocculosa]